MSNEETNQKPSEMNPEDLPEVRAFQDEFTRSFLQSIEETEAGYYPFLSGTGAYQMDFPAGGIVGERGYALKESEYEGYLIGVDNNNGTESSINFIYDDYKKSSNKENYLDNLEKRLGLNVKFEKIINDNQSLYVTYFERSEDTFTFAGYVQNELSPGGIQVIHETGCLNSIENCIDVKESSKKEIINWMQSIQYVEKEDESECYVMSGRILNTNEMRLRLIDLEYENLSEEQLIEQIKIIYIEEYGEELTANIDVFHSSESTLVANNNSGYDGTALYFYSEENYINEVYVISQGTQDMVDWEYNLEAMFAGLNYSQAEKTRDFVTDFKKEFNIDEISVPVIGLSHSLAHNNNTTAHLAFDIFDKVYSINGAQTNYYQLYYTDDDFAFKVRSNFSISRIDPYAIYNIDPQQLRTFAENYYADKAENIHQLISEDDPLYAISGVRGFFTLGEVDYYDTNPDFPGLRTLMEDIPDPVIKDFQELAVQYTVSSQRGGMQAAIQDILGVNLKVFDEVDMLNVYPPTCSSEKIEKQL
ncbi:DUF6792 domain-containing protein [Oceanobacillus longus]|uniref:DUF6792 domain-containing protein n=1 Tax=Oceanobacillus longus TaxID=930120 RepID=A0ABV8GXS6_9BACI